MEITANKLVAVGGSHWQKHGKNRVYFEIENYVDLSNNKKRKLGGVKLYFDLEDQKFYSTQTSCNAEVKEAISAIRAQLGSVKKPADPCCYNCKMFGTGLQLVGGSLGLLCAECYDLIEENL